MNGLTHDRLKEVLDYDPLTGVFRWKVDAGKKKIKAGSVAGGNRRDGYLRISIDGARYYGHRLAWFWMVGSWPDPECDHRDLDVSNNRWENLRLATSTQNKGNSGLRSDNTSGLKGLRWEVDRGRWLVRISIEGRMKNLGRYEDKGAAAAAYEAAAKQHFGEFARLE